MVCYPIILLIAGLNQHGTSNVFKQSIKNMTENCIEDLPTPLPDPYETKHFPSYLDKETKYYDGKENLGYIKYDDIKDTSITPFSVIKDNLKKYIEQYVDTDTPVAGKLKNIENEHSLDFIPLLLSKNSFDNKSFKSLGSKYSAKDVNENKANLEMKMKTNKPDNVKKLLRIGNNIPTIDDTNGLLRTLKDGSSFVVISDKYLNRPTNMDGIEQNPSFSPLNSENSEISRKYFEVSANYLAKLIGENINKLKEINIKFFRRIVQKFNRVIEEALNYIKRRNLEKDRSDWQNQQMSS